MREVTKKIKTAEALDEVKNKNFMFKNMNLIKNLNVISIIRKLVLKLNEIIINIKTNQIV